MLKHQPWIATCIHCTKEHRQRQDMWRETIRFLTLITEMHGKPFVRFNKQRLTSLIVEMLTLMLEGAPDVIPGAEEIGCYVERYVKREHGKAGGS